MDHPPRGLVYDQDMGIFKKDMKGNRLRFRVAGIGQGRNLAPDRIAVSEDIGGLSGRIVNKDVALTYELTDIRAGQQGVAGRQYLVQATPGVSFAG